MRLLLAEDDAMIGEAVQAGLRRQGFAVDWVRDGAAAEEALRLAPYDLCVLDLGLPRREGLEVLEALRRRGADLPVLIVTARDAVGQRVAGLDAVPTITWSSLDSANSADPRVARRAGRASAWLSTRASRWTRQRGP
jgi:CheY-like chemotaxis protein